MVGARGDCNREICLADPQSRVLIVRHLSKLRSYHLFSLISELNEKSNEMEVNKQLYCCFST